jgi:hypothetical protein
VLRGPSPRAWWIFRRKAVREYQNTNQNTYQPRPSQAPAAPFLGRRWRTQLPKCWPPSAAQTVHADFPHTAFTKIQASEMPKKESMATG